MSAAFASDNAAPAHPNVLAALQRVNDGPMRAYGADPVTGEPVRVIGAAHAGWRGLAAGVVEGTVEHMRRMGADRFDWDLGPCISPAAYAFGAGELDELCERLGPELAATTLDGEPALDLRAGVRAALARAGVDSGVGTGPAVVPCTALDDGFFSWRARQDEGRQAAVVWLANRTCPLSHGSMLCSCSD